MSETDEAVGRVEAEVDRLIRMAHQAGMDLAERVPKSKHPVTGDDVQEVKRTLLATLTRLTAERDALREDKARLDWLEGEYRRERAAIDAGKPIPYSLFRRNMVITRAALDTARGGAR